ncbi:glutamine amidotransferase [Halanaerobiaceae bacterium Z-7014]|uniref:Glutamine amidotransferase n=1 Tax=Halonatronomonas betaini TaxID=2778430 RepID=A0A931F920_9FIRM|nr:glutamine amidotransferase [Halonatronomonas betaini]MBF8437098.1 glutamine amidotransferase [Halonatronomonas betaini]
MKKLLIIKAGASLNKIVKKYGDFEELIINKANLRIEEIEIYKPFENKTFPDIDNIKGIIITGSHSMVTDDSQWIKNLSQELKHYLDNYNIPALGICFGHQLLAKIYGGKVDYHPVKKEIGSKEIFLTEAGKVNSLFKGLPNKFSSFLVHEQSVLELPEGAIRLANNNFENNQAFYLEDNIWGVQFHPEFTAGVMKEYILNDRDKLIKEGYNLDKLIRDLKKNTPGEKLIKNFIEIINK